MGFNEHPNLAYDQEDQSWIKEIGNGCIGRE